MTQPRTRANDDRRAGTLVAGFLVALIAWSAGFWAFAVLTETSPVEVAMLLSGVVAVAGIGLAVRRHVAAGTGAVLATLLAPFVNLLVLVVLVGD